MPDPIEAARTRADAEVTAAEQEAAEAAQLVGTLEERVREGDDSVTVEEIAGARELGRFARLRAEAARRKAEKAKRMARLAACEELRAEIEQHATGAGAELSSLLQAAQDAVSAFVTAVDERNVRIHAWHQRMQALGVPEHLAPIAPPAEHGRLGYRGQSVIAGMRHMDRTAAQVWLSQMLTHLMRDFESLHQIEAPLRGSGGDPAAMYEKLGALDASAPEPMANLVFFRGPNGSVTQYDPERAPSAEDIARLGLKKISRKEAWGE